MIKDVERRNRIVTDLEETISGSYFVMKQAQEEIDRQNPSVNVYDTRLERLNRIVTDLEETISGSFFVMRQAQEEIDRQNQELNVILGLWLLSSVFLLAIIISLLIMLGTT